MNQRGSMGVGANVSQRRLAAIALLVVLYASPACAAREHFMRGTVVAVNPMQLDVRHKSGQVVPFTLSPSTTYRWDHESISRDDVAVGARVVVYFGEPRGPFVARDVRVITRPRTSRAPRVRPD